MHSKKNRYSTCKAIYQVLQPLVIPKLFEEVWRVLEKDFSEKWNFSNTIAVIDGKHVLIQAPPHSGLNYFCYKKHLSTVLLALVDTNYKFIVVDIGAFGKNSDASILRNSNLGKGLQNGTLNIPSPKILPGGNDVLPHVIIGDEAFPLCTNLKRPYSCDDAQRNKEKNYRLSRARNTVENTFGILSRKFRISERKWSMSQEYNVSIVIATCYLHNFLRNDTCHWTENDLNISISNMTGLQHLRNIGGNPKTDALAVRDCFKSYFNSAAGSVEWQLRRVRAGRRYT